MTKKAAIKHLEYLTNEINDEIFSAISCEAFNVAIDELKHSERIDRVLEIVDAWKYDNTWCVRDDVWNERMDAIKGEILALKGGEQE